MRCEGREFTLIYRKGGKVISNAMRVNGFQFKIQEVKDNNRVASKISKKRMS